MRSHQDSHLSSLITDAIIRACEKDAPYLRKLKIEGTVCITLDSESVVVAHVTETLINSVRCRCGPHETSSQSHESHFGRHHVFPDYFESPRQDRRSSEDIHNLAMRRTSSFDQGHIEIKRRRNSQGDSASSTCEHPEHHEDLHIVSDSQGSNNNHHDNHHRLGTTDIHFGHGVTNIHRPPHEHAQDGFGNGGNNVATEDNGSSHGNAPSSCDSNGGPTSSTAGALVIDLEQHHERMEEDDAPTLYMEQPIVRPDHQETDERSDSSQPQDYSRKSSTSLCSTSMIVSSTHPNVSTGRSLTTSYPAQEMTEADASSGHLMPRSGEQSHFEGGSQGACHHSEDMGRHVHHVEDWHEMSSRGMQISGMSVSVGHSLSHMYTPEDMLTHAKKHTKHSPAQSYFNEILKISAKKADLWNEAPRLKDISLDQRNKFFTEVESFCKDLRKYRPQVWTRLSQSLENRRMYLKNQTKDWGHNGHETSSKTCHPEEATSTSKSSLYTHEASASLASSQDNQITCPRHVDSHGRSVQVHPELSTHVFEPHGRVSSAHEQHIRGLHALPCSPSSDGRGAHSHKASTRSFERISQDHFSRSLQGHDLPSRSTTGHDLPTRSTPGHDLPSRSTTGHDLPTRSTTGHDLPTRSTPGHDLPTRSTPGHDLPTRSTPGHDLPTRSTPGQDLPTRSTTGHDLPTRSTTGHDLLTRSTPGHDLPTRSTPGHDLPTRSTTGHDLLTRSTPGHDLPTRSTTGHDLPTRGTPGHELPTRSTPGHHDSHSRNSHGSP